MKISRIMSTQHPDNVNIPFFSEKAVMDGDDEIKEAFYTFSHLRVDEQLWDAEGKEVDTFVVKKLLSRYGDYFKKNILGKDKFITFRVPNPEVEKNEGKILLETLHSIPRNFDLAKAFYNEDVAPVFEVVMPMCSSDQSIIRVHEYYKEFVIKAQQKKIYDDDIKISEWVGELNPQDIRVTPLFETKDAILNADKYVQRYIEFEKIKDLQRVWFARSDPALNYGSLSAVLLGKIGTYKLDQLQEKLSIPILPILGVGSAPFRGNFTPRNADKMVAGYPSIQTFTIQSAFKYDHGPKRVMDAIESINNTTRKAPLFVDVSFATHIIDRVEQEYQQTVRLLADTINLVSRHVPERRRRKLHIGLFGYARNSAGMQLPRAIKFCSALYSLGLPPDVFGLSQLSQNELEKIRESYPTIDLDLAQALQYLNKDNLKYFPSEVSQKVLRVADMFPHQMNEEHHEETTKVMQALRAQDILGLQENILSAGKIRKFLG